MNPFDDSPSYPPKTRVVVSTNPFEDPPPPPDTATDDASSLRDDDDDADDNNNNDNNNMNPNNDDPAEASWQYLGVLPYRRVPIYSNVHWDGGRGLASYPAGTLLTAAATRGGGGGTATTAASSSSTTSKFSDPRALWQKTTVTRCAGCPHGGPIATVTLPLTASTHFPTTLIRIMTVAGQRLARLEFPMPYLERRYTPFDILQIGFTGRCVLIVVLKDSLCLTFDFKGEAVLPPFYILPNAATSTAASDTLHLAEIYEGGVAVVSTQNQDAAIVELLDRYHDDSDYLQTAVHPTASRIVGTGPSNSGSSSSKQQSSSIHHEQSPLDSSSSGSSSNSSYYAVVTQLPTAAFAATHTALRYTAVAVLPRTRTEHRHPEVFLATSDHSVVTVHGATLKVVDVDCRDRMTAGAIVDMCLAPNGRFLACFTEQSMLTVISTNFETKVLDFDTSEGASRSTPLEMQWCGEDSVVLHWKNLGVLMVGPYGDWLRFPYGNGSGGGGGQHLFLLPEMDCCRVITDRTVEILQRVPPATALLLRIGSIETSAMLLDAADAYYSRDSSSGGGSGMVISEAQQLQEAIETCTDSATKEFDIWTQKRLLRAASYGMHFAYKQNTTATGNGDDSTNERTVLIGGPVTGSDPETGLLPTKTTVKFVDAARKLRILNALRNPDVGFLLTAAQFDALTPAGVVARLIALQRPELAVEIAKYLKLPQSVQLFARAAKAAAFVADATELSDTETAERAIRILHGGGGGGGSSGDDHPSSPPSLNRGGYATVAHAANRVQRPGVANLLLILESSVADKVPALISTGNFGDAMAVATSSRDADLIFATLMEYERACMRTANPTDVSKAQAAFFTSVISSFTSEGTHTLRRYIQTTGDTKKLTTFLLKGQRTAEAGAAYAMRALKENDFREKQGLLSEASRIFGLGKETAFHKSSTDDYVELLKDQETLRKKYGSQDVAPVSTSVTATISAVLKYASTNEGLREQHRLLQDADKLARRFRIPDKRFWHIKVKAFADSNQWSNLKSLGDSRKSPIGYAPFARAVIRGKQPDNEIKHYLRKISVQEERYDLLCEAGMWREALDIATELKDPRRLLNVKSLCNNEALQLEVDQRLGSLA